MRPAGRHFRLQLLRYRRKRSTAAADVMELALLLAAVLTYGLMDEILVVVFQMALFRGLSERFGRLGLMLLGYLGVWFGAIALNALAPIDGGAAFSLLMVGFLTGGVRALLLRLQTQHQRERARLEGMLKRLPQPLVITDAGGRVVLVNTAATTLLGWSADDQPLLSALCLRDIDEQPVDLTVIAANTAATGSGVAGLELRWARPDGGTSLLVVETLQIEAQQGTEPGAVVAVVDETAQRLYEENLYHVAHHDALTGLPNRMRWEQLLNAVVTDRLPYAVALIDLNGFKLINDSLGHQVGDELLQAVSGRMRDAVGSRGTVARLGGDEFAVLMPGPSAQAAGAITESIRESFIEPFNLSPGLIQGAGSVGWAVAAGQPAEDVVAEADKAMYEAKRRDRCPTDRSESAADAAQNSAQLTAQAAASRSTASRT